MEWITDRRPEKAGSYLVTIEYEGGSYNTATGELDQGRRLCREVDTRYYAKPGVYGSWAMTGEDPKDYHWTEQNGSFMGERVVAWCPIVKAFRGDLKPRTEYVIEDLGPDKEKCHYARKEYDNGQQANGREVR